MSRARTTSPVASASVLPSSRVSVRATSSRRSVSSSAALKRMAPRAGAGVAAHAGKASAAAATAWAASPAVALGNTARTSSACAGFLVSKLAWSLAPTHSPPIRFLQLSMVHPDVAMPGLTWPQRYYVLRPLPPCTDADHGAEDVRVWSGQPLWAASWMASATTSRAAPDGAAGAQSRARRVAWRRSRCVRHGRGQSPGGAGRARERPGPAVPRGRCSTSCGVVSPARAARSVLARAPAPRRFSHTTIAEPTNATTAGDVPRQDPTSRRRSRRRRPATVSCRPNAADAPPPPRR